ncbi:nucleotidyltransferase family protein [Fibrella forsythiae]|uniref:Nucleotidyltransferase domain-containing protein n=1 Tax=Fibrella forsythiae TaxID=2817061 RepID=A0ABS3JCT9_9BACT|nr:nucleotidyltransferase domain-containing protein [Fibrella forsythiae]MBO0947808.1 nucleotidyltransferase domain-containing protein [Fibrella forsythiae]
MSLQPIISRNLPIITQILKQNRVKRAYAFGSVCTDQFGPKSDIDLLIAFDDGLDPVVYAENYFAIAEEMEALLKRPVDLVTEASVHNPYFIKVMNQTKTVIYEG